MSSSQLIEYGSEGTTYRAQATCRECGAWLPQMPQRSAVVIPREEGENPLYLYLWICDHCNRIRMVESFSSPEEYKPLPKSEVHKPGSYPPPILRDPLQWDNGYMLTPAARKLVVACWEMIDDMNRIRGQLQIISEFEISCEVGS